MTVFDTTCNPAEIGYTNGNLTATTTGTNANLYEAKCTVGHSSGKYAFRVTNTGTGSNPSPFNLVGIAKTFVSGPNQGPGVTNDSYGYYQQTGQSYYNNVLSAFGASYDTGDVITCYVDMTALKLYFDKNGTYQGGGDPSAGTGGISIPFTGTVYPCIALYKQNYGMTLAASRSDVGSLPAGWLAWDAP